MCSSDQRSSDERVPLTKKPLTNGSLTNGALTKNPLTKGATPNEVLNLVLTKLDIELGLAQPQLVF